MGDGLGVGVGVGVGNGVAEGVATGEITGEGVGEIVLIFLGFVNFIITAEEIMASAKIITIGDRPFWFNEVMGN